MPTIPKFSSRLATDLEENAISRVLEAKRAAGLEILDLTESNPTRAGFLYPEKEILAALGKPDALAYQPEPKGLSTAREAVARYFRESRSAPIDREKIFLTASTSEAYALVFKLLCDAGDAVLVPAPSYPLFGLLTALESVRAVEYPLRWDGEWHIELPALEEILSREPRARAILLVSPGNPTGAYLKKTEHARLLEICAARGLSLISDEVFADYPVAIDENSRKERQETCAVDSAVLTFTLSGLSKVCGLPQLKLGWCALNGPEKLVREAGARLELIADTYLSVATPVQLALPELLSMRHEIQQQIRERCAKNRAAISAARKTDSSWDLLASEGGWSAILRVPSARSEDALVLELLEKKVLVQPGYFYELSFGNHLVLSLLTRETIFARALELFAESSAHW